MSCFPEDQGALAHDLAIKQRALPPSSTSTIICQTGQKKINKEREMRRIGSNIQPWTLVSMQTVDDTPGEAEEARGRWRLRAAAQLPSSPGLIIPGSLGAAPSITYLVLPWFEAGMMGRVVYGNQRGAKVASLSPSSSSSSSFRSFTVLRRSRNLIPHVSSADFLSCSWRFPLLKF